MNWPLFSSTWTALRHHHQTARQRHRAPAISQLHSGLHGSNPPYNSSIYDSMQQRDEARPLARISALCSLHTHNHLMALFLGLPGWASTRRNIHPLTPMKKKKDAHTQHTRSALSQRGLLDPIKPAYNHSRPNGRLKLTASAFDYMDQYASSPCRSTYCYTELVASFTNFLHYYSPSSGFCGAGKDNRGRRTDNPSERHPIWTIGAPTSIILLFWRRMPFLLQPSQFILAWDMHQIMLACIPSGLVCLCSLHCTDNDGSVTVKTSGL